MTSIVTIYLVCDAVTNRDIGYARLPDELAKDKSVMDRECVYVLDRTYVPIGREAPFLKSPEEFHLWAQGGS